MIVEYLSWFGTLIEMKLVIGVIACVGIFLVYIEMILRSLNNYMWKSKHFLGMVPLEKMIVRKEAIIGIIKRVS